MDSTASRFASWTVVLITTLPLNTLPRPTSGWCLTACAIVLFPGASRSSQCASNGQGCALAGGLRAGCPEAAATAISSFGGNRAASNPDAAGAADRLAAAAAMAAACTSGSCARCASAAAASSKARAFHSLRSAVCGEHKLERAINVKGSGCQAHESDSVAAPATSAAARAGGAAAAGAGGNESIGM